MLYAALHHPALGEPMLPTGAVGSAVGVGAAHESDMTALD